MNLAYTAVFTPCEEGGYMVTVPDLPGMDEHFCRAE